MSSAAEGRPRLLRLSFSHYCQKAEWALTAAGIRYDTEDLGLRRLAKWMPHILGGTVPLLRTPEGRLIPGSAAILAWAEAHRAQGAPSLYPSKAVATWEAWADDVVGPAARRLSYRCLYERPRQYGRRRRVHLAARLGRRPLLGILRFYKVRRHAEADEAAFAEALEHIRAQVVKKKTGYLLAGHATAADIATAALIAPALAIQDHPLRGSPGWQEAQDLVRRVRPRQVLRHRSRKARRIADWQ